MNLRYSLLLGGSSSTKDAIIHAYNRIDQIDFEENWGIVCTLYFTLVFIFNNNRYLKLLARYTFLAHNSARLHLMGLLERGLGSSLCAGLLFIPLISIDLVDEGEYFQEGFLLVNILISI